MSIEPPVDAPPTVAVPAGAGSAEFAAIFEHLPWAVVRCDYRRVVDANRAARTLLGPVVGWRLEDALAEPTLVAAVRRAHDDGESVEVRVTRDGRDLEGRSWPTGSDSTALALADLTEIRRVDAVRRDFVTNASHELKTPVAGILALTESLPLALHRDPERGRSMLERLRVEATRLTRLVRDLLDLSRLEEVASGQPRAVDLAGVVRIQLDRLAPLIAERDLRVELDVRQATVVALPSDLRLIVGNLVDNAVRYNRHGGRISVSLSGAGGRVQLTVADTGIGIPEEARERVFERFYRVDKGRSRAMGGTGLGLALVRHAVERLQGHVRVESTPGEGSVFTVTLPVEGSAADVRLDEQEVGVRRRAVVEAPALRPPP